MKKAWLLLLLPTASASAQWGGFPSALRSVTRGQCDTNSCAASLCAARREATLNCAALIATVEAQRFGTNEAALNQFGRVRPVASGAPITPENPRTVVNASTPPTTVPTLPDAVASPPTSPTPSNPSPSNPTPDASGRSGGDLDPLPRRSESRPSTPAATPEAISPRSGAATSESERIKAGSGGSRTAPDGAGRTSRPR